MTLPLKLEHTRHIGVRLIDERPRDAQTKDVRTIGELNDPEKSAAQPPGSISAAQRLVARTHPQKPETVSWEEDSVLALPPDNDRVERLGASLLDLTLPGVAQSRLRSELARHLSAFANTGGGQIIYGLSKNGVVDRGGVSRVIKGRRPTKEWLENIIPGLTESEIVGVTVFEVLPKPHDSALGDGKAIYVINVPHSERAPHQSVADLLYYVRLGGKSQAACHSLIEDIRARVNHPDLSVTEVSLVDVFLSREKSPGVAGTMGCRLQVGLKNLGVSRASRACVQIEAEPLAFFGDFDNAAVIPRRTAAENIMFWEIQGPLYPGMEINFWFDLMLPTDLLRPVPALRGAVGIPKEMTIACRLLVDNTTAKSRTFELGKLAADRYTESSAGSAAAGIGSINFLELESCTAASALSLVSE